MMETVRLSSEAWSYQPVSKARGFLDRLRGMKMVGPRDAVLLETSSVHAIGIKHPFWAVGMSNDHVVMEVMTVRPWTIVRLPGCRYVVELPLDVEPPSVGTKLDVRDV